MQQEPEDEEGDATVEQLVKEVQWEEGKGKEDQIEKEEKEDKEKKPETGVEYLEEIPDEETLKTIDKMLVEEEKRVNAELRRTSVTDDKIADKIASLGYGIQPSFPSSLSPTLYAPSSLSLPFPLLPLQISLNFV